MKWLLFLLPFFCHAKILVLTIASDEKPYYRELQKVWRTYMNYDPKQVEAYFLKMSPTLDRPYKIEDQVVWIKGEENFIPAIADKTILAMEIFRPRLKEFDYVIRTNLSSFIVFPRLLEYLNTLPKTKCYCACENQIIQGPGKPYIPFGSGAGLIFSPDLVELMVLNKKALLGNATIDDVLFGWFFHLQDVPLIIAKRMDILDKASWAAWKNRLPNDQYHFRLKNPDDRRLTDEVQMHRELVKMFYHL